MRYKIDKSEWYKCKLCSSTIEELRKKYGGANIYSTIVFTKHLEIEHNISCKEYFDNIIPICSCGICNKRCVLNTKPSANFTYHSGCGRNPGQQKWSEEAKISRLGSNNPMYGKIPWNKGQEFPDSIKRKMRISAVERIRRGDIRYTNTVPHRKMCSLLDTLNIKYINEYIIDIYSFDIYLTELNIVIEVDGDYWHCNPIKYPNGPINNMQKINICKDNRKNNFCKLNNIRLIRFWENDIKNNESQVICTLKELLV